MSDDQPDTPKEAQPEAEAAASCQEDKPIAQSASPSGEDEAAQKGEGRPADPQDADDVLTHKLNEQAPAGAERNAADADVLAASAKRTRRAFIGFAAAAAAAYGFRRYLKDAPFDEMIPGFLHKNYAWNAEVSRSVFRDQALAPTYPRSRAETLRVNGVFGLKKQLKPETYRLQVVGVRDAEKSPLYVSDVTAWEYSYQESNSHEDVGHDTKTDPSKMSSSKMAPEGMLQKSEEDENQTGRKPRGLEESGESDSTLLPQTPGLLLGLQDFLPHLQRQELVLQFKCIEGWSQIVQWAGVRFADFINMFPPALIDGKSPAMCIWRRPTEITTSATICITFAIRRRFWSQR